MSRRNLLEGLSPLTQSAEAVKQLIEYVTGKPCEEQPAIFKLADGAQLTKSSKGDAYYFGCDANRPSRSAHRLICSRISLR